MAGGQPRVAPGVPESSTQLFFWPTLLALWESRDGAAATVTVPLAGRGSARTDSEVAILAA